MRPLKLQPLVLRSSGWTWPGVSGSLPRGSKSAWGAQDLLLALAIFLCAMSVRVAATYLFVGLGSEPDRQAAGLDVVDYEEFAWSMACGRGYALEDGTPTARRAPGTSLCILPIYLIFGRSYTATHWWFCILSAATCAVTYWFARLEFDRLPSLVAGLWLTFYPGHFYYSMHFLSEVPLGLTLILACVLTLLACRRQQFSLYVLAGFCCGATILIRPNLMLALPIGIALALLQPTPHKWPTLRRVGILLATSVAVLIPWMARNWIVKGKPVLATILGGYTFWGAHNDIVLHDPNLRGSWVFDHRLITQDTPLNGQDELARGQQAWAYGLRFAIDNIAHLPHLELAKLYRLITPFHQTNNRPVYWVFALSWMIMVPCLVVGLPVVWKRRQFALISVAPMIAIVFTALIFYGSIRFRDSLAPLLVTPAAVGAIQVLNWAIALSHGRWGRQGHEQFLKSFEQ